ncbi:MAG: VacJ family lipoprotein [Pararhodobacter sp.]
MGFIGERAIGGLLRRFALVLAVTGGLSACAGRPPAQDINDPFEATNRAWFDSNLALQGAIPAEAGDTDTNTGQGNGLRRLVRNFGSNLSVPGTVVNDLLQFRLDRAVENTLRFAINSTIGLGGLFDPAGQIGLHGRRSDFGETLYIWGMDEGAYLVLPVIGPSTERDALGLVVDVFLDPWHHFAVTRPEYRATVAARWAAHYAELLEYSDLLDANVMQSADPYVQARLLFLQARRYHLGIETEDDFIDPYADFFD